MAKHPHPAAPRTDAAIRRWLEQFDDELTEHTVLADGLAFAFVGAEMIDEQDEYLVHPDENAIGTKGFALIYSEPRAIRLFIAQGMTPEEAREHFEFNVACAHVGLFTPRWIQTP